MVVARSVWQEGCHHHVVGVGHELESYWGLMGGGGFGFPPLTRGY
jgi:hypothetical protein